MSPTDKLSAAQIADFEKQGFLIVEDLFDRQAMQALKQHSIELCLAPDTPSDLVKINALVRDGVVQRQGPAALHSLFRPQVISRRFRDFVCAPRCTGPLTSLLGPDVITFNGLVIYKVKELGLGFPYHQDMWYFSKNNQIRRSCAIWLALDDADVENGCLHVVPGSHTMGILEHSEPESEHVQQEFREVQQARDMDEIAVPLRSGSALFFDGQLLHRSGENHSQRDRACYVIHNAPADTIWGWAGVQGPLGGEIMRACGSREPRFAAGKGPL